MKQLLVKYKPELLGSGVGAASGFAYWYFIGCASGTCAITSNPVISTIYGAVTGALIFNLLRQKKEK